MHSETFIPVNLEPAFGVNRNQGQPPRSNRKRHLTVRTLTRGITSGITVLYNNTARTTLWIVARAEMLVLKTASARHFWSRREGGPK